MTVMFQRFFGVPQHVVRSGLWKRMKPAQQSLYVALLFDSERCCTRELIRSDQQLTDLTGVSPRSLRDARIKLQEYGLIQYEHRSGLKHRYVLCDPETGKPHPGDPKAGIPYLRRGNRGSPVPISDHHSEKVRERPRARADKPQLPVGDPVGHGVPPSGRPQSSDHDELAGHGVRLDFK